MVTLRDYRLIVLNSSAGKDSQAMLDVMVERAREENVMDRLIVVHADLGRVEWKGTRELAERQAAHYKLPFYTVERTLGDLLQQVEERGKWPGHATRYCTADQKTAQVCKLINRLVNPTRQELLRSGRPWVLNCLGIRAAESAKRAAMNPYERDERQTNGKRVVWRYYPLFTWTESQVWARIAQSGVEHHSAYDLGMPRLSCAFCPLANPKAWMLAGKHNPELLAEYVAVEARIGHKFSMVDKKPYAIATIQQRLAAGEEPVPVTTWEE